MFGKSGRKVGDIIEPDADRLSERETLARIRGPQVKSTVVASSVPPPAPEASSIGSGLSIVGNIFGNERVAIYGHVEGEIHALTVQIGDGAQVVGNIVSEEITIGGRVKGTIHGNRVKLNSTAVVEGDIYHRSLAIEENAHFEGMSRRQENVIDIPSVVPANLPRAQQLSINVHKLGNGASDSLNP